MLLVRVCGSQPWFGEFMGKVLQDYFHSEAAEVFPQDRYSIYLYSHDIHEQHKRRRNFEEEKKQYCLLSYIDELES